MARKNLSVIARPAWVVSALFVVHGTMAAEASLPAHQAEKTNCAVGARDCALAMPMDPKIREATRQAREAMCGRNTQDCDARGRARRRDAVVEVRDRHACRDK
jgi:hypothetical protein